MLLATIVDLCVWFKRNMKEAPIYLTIESRIEISMGRQENSLPKSSCYIYICRSSQKTNKKSNFIYPPRMAQSYIDIYIQGFYKSY